MIEPTTKPKRKTPRIHPVSFYLGDVEDRNVRKEHLDNIAKEFGVNRSVMLQMIADGELEVRPK